MSVAEQVQEVTKNNKAEAIQPEASVAEAQCLCNGYSDRG